MKPNTIRGKTQDAIPRPVDWIDKPPCETGGQPQIQNAIVARVPDVDIDRNIPNPEWAGHVDDCCVCSASKTRGAGEGRGGGTILAQLA